MKKKIYLGKIVTLVANALTVALLVVLLYSQLMLSHQGPHAFTYSNFLDFVMQNYNRAFVACGFGNSIFALVVGLVAIVVMIIKKQHKNYLYEAISFIFAGLIAGFALRYYDFINTELSHYISSLDKQLYILIYVTFVVAILIIPTSIVRVVAAHKAKTGEETSKEEKTSKVAPVMAEMSKEEKRTLKAQQKEEFLRRHYEEKVKLEKEKKLMLEKKAEEIGDREQEKLNREKAKKLMLEKRAIELAKKYKEKKAQKALKIQLKEKARLERIKAREKAREEREAEKASRLAIKEKEKRAAALAEQRRQAKLRAERIAKQKAAKEAKIAAEKRRAYLKSDAYKAKVKYERRKRRYIRHYMLTHRK